MTATRAPARTPEEERRHRRADWPVRRFRLGDEPDEDLSATSTAEQRLAMMWPLALDAFSLANESLASSPRSHWPVKVRRLDDPEVD